MRNTITNDLNMALFDSQDERSVYDRKNVKMIKSVFSKTEWGNIFARFSSGNPSLYNYEMFLEAASRFPKFCGEYHGGTS